MLSVPRPRLLLGAAIFAVAVALYAPSIVHPFSPFDDIQVIVRNPIVHALNARTVAKAFTSYDPELYIPLTLLSFQIDWLLGDGEAFVFHLTNVLLHGINAVLVFAFVLALFPKRSLLLPTIAGLLFAIHPMAANTVPWATARKDLLAAAFALATLLSYVLATRLNRRSLYVVSLFCFLLALLSKVAVLCLPLLLPLIDVLLGRRPSVRRSLPFVLFSIVFFAIARVGKSALLNGVPFTFMLMMAPRSVLYYLTSYVVPFNLTLTVPLAQRVSLEDMPVAFLIAVGLVIAFVIAFVRSRSRLLLFGATFFLVFLAPSFANYSAANIDYLGSVRHAYLASAGLAAIVGGIIVSIVLSMRARGSRIVVIAVIVIAGACVTRESIQQMRLWGDPQLLAASLSEQFPFYPFAHSILGEIAEQRGNHAEAVDAYAHAVRLRPNDWSLHYALGRGLANQGDASKALAVLHKATRLEQYAPGPYILRANIHMHAREWEQAEQELQSVLAFSPEDLDALVTLGVLYGQWGKPEQEEQQYEQALAVDPTSPLARYNLSVALIRAGRNAEAAEHLDLLQQQHPRFTATKALRGMIEER